jgi:tetratricopeptide (TPR) repeat protein
MNFTSFEKVAHRNYAKKSAIQAYQKGDYATALFFFQEVESATFLSEPAIRYNLANCYFRLSKMQDAKKYFLPLSNIQNNLLAADVCNQLGGIYLVEQDSLKALDSFALALQKNPENTEARYNFEWLKKRYHPKHSNKNTTSPPKPRPNQSESNLAQLDKNHKQEDILKKLRQYNLNAETAKQILDAMRNTEIQYIQQQKRKNISESKLPQW